MRYEAVENEDVKSEPVTLRSGGGNIVWAHPKPMPDGHVNVPEFDPVLLPEVFSAWVEDIAERIQCPPDYLAIGVMVGLSSIVGRQIGVRPRNHDDWTVVPNLWGAIIGRPGLLKSPALSEAMRPLNMLETGAREKYDAEICEFEANCIVEKAEAKQAEKDIAKAVKAGDGHLAHELAADSVNRADQSPIRRRYVTSDTTVEKLGELLSANEHGVMIYRDELTGWLRDLSREGREGSRSFYLEAWNGNGRYTYDRIGRGTIDIDAACVSILGGIQPGPLGAYLNDALQGGAGDDGLLQRFQLAVWPDPPAIWRDVDRCPDSNARAEAFSVYQRLNDIDVTAIGASRDDEVSMPYLRLSAAAYELFSDWRSNLEVRIREGCEHPAFESVLAKYRSLVPSIALLFHLADCPNGGAVSEIAMVSAIGWSEYLEAHARRIYAPAIDPSLHAARELDRHICAGDLPTGFKARDVYVKGWRLLGRHGTTDALEYLEDLGRVRREPVDPGASGGRRTTLWHIHPDLGAK